jgi:hypothetical protein
MNLDPHTLSQIIQKIYQQMRCPQCGKRVPVDMASIRIAADDFMLMQLKCDTCDAYIVLHAALQGAENIGVSTEKETTVNASSTFALHENEVEMLQEALGKSGGSFEKLFSTFGGDAKKVKDIDASNGTQIA